EVMIGVDPASPPAVVPKPEQTEFERDLDGTRFYFVSHTMYNDWDIVGMVPVHEVVSDIVNLQQTIWLYATVLLLAASLIGVLFSRRITSPVLELMQQMRQVERSDFTAQTNVRSRDEIGQLSVRFNQMV